MIDYFVREKTSECDRKIKDFFYDTFYVPEGTSTLPREILTIPYYQKYYDGLGSRKGDYCYEAYDTHRKCIIGIVWTRLISGELNIDSRVPFLMVSVSAEYRGMGVGSALMVRILSELQHAGYNKVILSVHRHNRALALYERHGFFIYDSDEENYMMMKLL